MLSTFTSDSLDSSRLSPRGTKILWNLTSQRETLISLVHRILGHWGRISTYIIFYAAYEAEVKNEWYERRRKCDDDVCTEDSDVSVKVNNWLFVGLGTWKCTYEMGQDPDLDAHSIFFKNMWQLLSETLEVSLLWFNCAWFILAT